MIYDPDNTFNSTHFDLHHDYVNWNYPERIDAVITTAQKSGEFPIITIEPLHKEGMDLTILCDISAGKYDDRISAMANTIKKHSPQVVMIRIFHEMVVCRTLRMVKVCLISQSLPGNMSSI
jgi:hypothetical protein